MAVSIWQLVIWFVPFFYIAFSNRSKGFAKFLWLFASILFSWVVGLIFYFTARIKPESANDI